MLQGFSKACFGIKSQQSSVLYVVVVVLERLLFVALVLSILVIAVVIVVVVLAAVVEVALILLIVLVEGHWRSRSRTVLIYILSVVVKHIFVLVDKKASQTCKADTP